MAFLIHNLKYQIFFQHLLQCLRKYLLFLCRLWSYLYPCNIMLIFLFILVSRSHTKTHTLLLYWFPKLLDLNILVTWIHLFLISIANQYSENLVLTPNNSFLLCLLQSWYPYVFLNFRYSFQHLHCSSARKIVFQNHFLHFFKLRIQIKIWF